MSTVSDLIAHSLSARGVRRAFGVPGGDVLPLIESLAAVDIDFTLVRHEASAAFMAEATWHLLGTPGVCVSTLGPGATNLLTGVAGAALDRARVLAVTGRSPTRLWGAYTHMELDHGALFEPLVKGHFVAGGGAVHEAMACLDEGRPGPVHLDLPADVATARGGEVRPVSGPPLHVADPGLAVARFAVARRPVILVGAGALDDGTAAGVRVLAAAAGAPVLTTYRAKGMVDEVDDPWSAGAFGLSPVIDVHQRALIEGADLVVAVGLDPVELRPDWTRAWFGGREVIGIDPHGQPDLPVSIDVVGEPVATLSALSVVARPGGWAPEEVAAHRASVALWDHDRGPAAAIRAVQRATPPEALATVDVGAHRITLSHTWTCRRPRTLLQSNGLSSMASALPYAIAGAMAQPGRPVVCVTGDLGLAMAMGELGTARGLDLVVVVLVDAALSLIAIKQERLGLSARGVNHVNPDLVAIARAFGGEGQVAEGADAVETATRRAFAAGGLQLVEVRIDPRPYRDQM